MASRFIRSNCCNAPVEGIIVLIEETRWIECTVCKLIIDWAEEGAELV